MFKRLKLTNFRQHRDREFNLEEGLVVLRGANEAGKSTLIASILYLWFGSRVLGEPLADVVTYGEPEKTLRVEGSFTIDGVDYEAYRAKSGAEIQYGTNRVTGAEAVTQFMENLLGAKADVVRKLMVAEQNSIRGVLESEAGAGALIEGLADLGLIDVLIDKIKFQLPCGPTVATASTLSALRDTIGQQPVAPSEDGVTVLQAKLAEAKDEVAAHESVVTESRSAAEEAGRVFTEAKLAQQAYDTVVQREMTLRAEVMPVGLRPYTDESIDKALQVEKDTAYAAKVAEARSWVPKTHERTWTGTEESLILAAQDHNGKIADTHRKIADIREQRAYAVALKINEKVCSFCKKDISQLPEVEAANVAADSRVRELDEQLAKLKADLQELDDNYRVMRAIMLVHRANTSAVNKSFWEEVPGLLPASFAWIGPETVDSQSLPVSSSAMREANAKYDKAFAKWNAVQEELACIRYPQLVPSSAVAAAELAQTNYTRLSQTHDTLVRAVTAVAAELQSAEAVYAVELRQYKEAVARREKAIKDVETTEKLLKDMEFNNQLLKDLAAARTEIRRRMWDSVTAAISLYFSRIRKVETRITQSSGMFLQNGKSVKGLSGSAKDMLGLAIRAGLLKTFIPDAPMLVVDEPFSGCDDDREVAGLGVLSALGFPQTILVTHSDLADSMANQLVQL